MKTIVFVVALLIAAQVQGQARGPTRGPATRPITPATTRSTTEADLRRIIADLQRQVADYRQEAEALKRELATAKIELATANKQLSDLKPQPGAKTFTVGMTLQQAEIAGKNFQYTVIKSEQLVGGKVVTRETWTAGMWYPGIFEKLYFTNGVLTEIEVH